MKNKKYDIRINPPGPSPEIAGKYKDFDALLEKFEEHKETSQSSLSGRIIKIGLTAFITVAAALLVYFGPPVITSLGPSVPRAVERPYVNPPLEKVTPRFTNFEVDAYKGGTFIYESGSKLVVPPGAFIDFNGNPVTGAVQLEYREFHDPVDFFLSGIPMAYDSAGVRFNLESAGMMEVYAKKDGKKLNMKPGATIAVQLVSAVRTNGDLADYNLYQLDIDNRNWVYKGPNRMELLEPDEQDSVMQKLSEPELELKNLDAELNALLEEQQAKKAGLEARIPSPPQPEPPRKADEKGFVFDLDINKEEFPDLSVYEKVMWEVIHVPQNDFFHAGLYDVHWDDASLNLQSKNNYLLTLSRPDQTIQVLVTPVLTGNDYRQANDTFKEKFKLYQAEKSKRDQKIAEELKILEAEVKAEKEAIEARRKELERELAMLKKSGNHRAYSELVLRKKVVSSFNVNELGIWNCDRPLPEFKYNCNFTLVNKEGQQYLDNAAFFLDRSLNTIHRFYAMSENTIGFNEQSEHLLWLVTREGKIAIFRPEEFKKLERKANHTLTLDLIDKEINSEQDIREILAL